MECQNELIHAYHDGELPADRRAAVEAHVNACDPCGALLADLRRMSQLVAAAPMADLPPHAMKRMQQAWWAAQDRGVRRIAGWLTAAAAAVIFAAVILSPSQRPESSPSFQLATLMPPAESPEQDEPQNEVIDAAQWIANDIALAMR